MFAFRFRIKRKSSIRTKKKVVSVKRQHYLAHKESARILIHSLVEKHNQNYNFNYNKIFIKNQRTVWGSCSSNKNLNFNYKIMFLPDHLQDYIVIHELCHLGELNHTHRFWALVEKTMPNYKSVRRQLKTYEQELF